MQFNPRPNIIERADLLSPEAMPEKITGRARQVEKLQSCLRAAERGFPPVSAWLYGSPGTGKTAIARKVAGQACSSPYRMSLYVNCWERATLYSVVQALCEQLKVLGAEAQDTNVKFCRMKQALKGKAVLIILDEIDRPMPKERESIIHQLLQLPKTGLFCISGSCSAFVNLDNRVCSKLTPVPVRFPRYTDDEIKGILAERASYVLIPETYTDDVLQKIAVLADGDARRALHLLLKAAITAEGDSADKIANKHIPADVSAWQDLEKKARIELLPLHQRIIYKLARENGQISSSDLRALYVLQCSRRSLVPVAQRTFSKYVGLLVSKDLIRVESKAVGSTSRLLKA